MRITEKNLPIMLKRSFSKDYYNKNYMLDMKAILELVDLLEEDPYDVILSVFNLGFMQGQRSITRKR